MNDLHPIFRDFRVRISYLALWFSVSIIQAILNSLFGYRIGLGMACVDALIFNALFAIGILPLWYPIRFHASKSSRSFTILSSTLLPYMLLAGILITGWLSAGNHLMQWLIPHPDYRTFLHFSTGWRILQGIFLYVIALLCYTRYAHIMELTENITTLKRTIERQKGEMTRITIRDRQKIHIIDIQEIDYIEAFGDYIQLHTAKGTFLKEHTMKFLEEQLPSAQFVRIHRSYIVNIQQVAKIELYEKEHYHVHLKNGKALKTSDTGYKLLKEALR